MRRFRTVSPSLALGVALRMATSIYLRLPARREEVETALHDRAQPGEVVSRRRREKEPREAIEQVVDEYAELHTPEIFVRAIEDGGTRENLSKRKMGDVATIVGRNLGADLDPLTFGHVSPGESEKIAHVHMSLSVLY